MSDPEKKVSRRHSTIEYASGRCWLVDGGSANGTFLRQGGNSKAEIDMRSLETMPLADGDVILILGKLLPGDRPVFWELKFRDPGETQRIEGFQPLAEMEYNLDRKQLFRITRQHREEIKLSPQERDLIDYMVQKNLANNYQAIVCQYEELIKAIWGETFGRTNNEINRLVWAVRDKIELDSGEPKFLKTVRGEGYLLEVGIV
ncbi:MAG: winged helix-turn-helix domain-containing protein [Cyanosarcina radialis HA8281-LM2]|nr:winged helix-turn-helix domain-containing protein [Cyanosarcina radialis HA8281-LM2]